ncbi:hypothetical protein [Shouchella shacheensis]|uniref:hypothetical protein n=1 Tax=Shouchella shacheensis TaxID=1649580 RepID=UPI00073FB26D|nr:hypothetical protein [Shouchella shacheensis]
MGEIISYDKLKLMERTQQNYYLEYWQKNYSNKEIADGLGISQSYLYKLFDELGIKKRKKRGRKPNQVISSFVYNKDDTIRLLQDKKEYTQDVKDIIDSDEVIPYERYRRLKPNVRMLLILMYSKGRSFEQLTEEMNADLSYVYRERNLAIKRYQKFFGKPNNEQDTLPSDNTSEYETIEDTKKEKPERYELDLNDETVNLTLIGNYAKGKVNKRLSTLLQLLEDLDSEDLNVNIQMSVQRNNHSE